MLPAACCFAITRCGPIHHLSISYAQFHGAGNDTAVIAAAQKLMTPGLIAFLSQPDSIANPDGLDADMVRCTANLDII